MHDAPTNRKADWQPLTLSLLLVAAGVTILFRLLPTDVRPWNLAPAGAMFLFAGARARSAWMFLIPFLPSLVLDVYLSSHYGGPLPYPTYLAYGVYVLIGWGLLRRSESPVMIAGTALLGAVAFFFVTNTGAWVEMRLHPQMWLGDAYCDATWAGLMKCYVQAIPFSKGTFFGDLIFSAVLFGAFARLSRTYFVEERVAAGVDRG